jgi:hypothetical protein
MAAKAGGVGEWRGGMGVGAWGVRRTRYAILPLDESCRDAARKGHLNCLEYALDNGTKFSHWGHGYGQSMQRWLETRAISERLCRGVWHESIDSQQSH